MRLTQRVEPVHQAAPLHQRPRQRIRLVVFIQQQLHRVAQRLLPHARHGGIHRNDAARLLQRRVDDKQPALFADAAAIERHLAGIKQPLLHPRLVEPHAAHRTALVRNRRADPPHAARVMQRGLALHKAGEACLPPLGHLRRGKRARRILVAGRQGLHQIQRRLDPARGQRLEANRAEPLDAFK